MSLSSPAISKFMTILPEEDFSYDDGRGVYCVDGVPSIPPGPYVGLTAETTNLFSTYVGATPVYVGSIENWGREDLTVIVRASTYVAYSAVPSTVPIPGTFTLPFVLTMTHHLMAAWKIVRFGDTYSVASKTELLASRHMQDYIHLETRDVVSSATTTPNPQFYSGMRALTRIVSVPPGHLIDLSFLNYGVFTSSGVEDLTIAYPTNGMFAGVWAYGVAGGI